MKLHTSKIIALCSLSDLNKILQSKYKLRFFIIKFTTYKIAKLTYKIAKLTSFVMLKMINHI